MRAAWISVCVLAAGQDCLAKDCAGSHPIAGVVSSSLLAKTTSVAALQSSNDTIRMRCLHTYSQVRSKSQSWKYMRQCL